MDGEYPATRAIRGVVAVVVPAMALAAHGMAAGGTVTGSGLVLLLGVGAAAALAALPTTSAARPVPAAQTRWIRLAAVLAGAQVAAHTVLSAGSGHPHAAHIGIPVVDESVGMLTAHVIAVAVTTAMIAGGAHLIAVISSTLRALRRLAIGVVGERSGASATARATAPVPTVSAGGRGLRGPPAHV